MRFRVRSRSAISAFAFALSLPLRDFPHPGTPAFPSWAAWPWPWAPCGHTARGPCAPARARVAPGCTRWSRWGDPWRRHAAHLEDIIGKGLQQGLQQGPYNSIRASIGFRQGPSIQYGLQSTFNRVLHFNTGFNRTLLSFQQGPYISIRVSIGCARKPPAPRAPVPSRPASDCLRSMSDISLSTAASCYEVPRYRQLRGRPSSRARRVFDLEGKLHIPPKEPGWECTPYMIPTWYFVVPACARARGV